MSGRIMVVDDEADIRRLLEKRLVAAGYEVTAFPSAVEAIPQVGSLLPDVILLDVNMPEMDGWEACRRITAEHADIPIIFLTAQSDTEDRLAGFDAGARDYVSKPFSTAELLARIKATMREKQAREAEARRAETFEILAITDPLTGVSNRRYFDKVYAEELQRAMRDHFEVSCLMIDIDKFKSVNDTYGHAVGDIVIAAVAAILKANVRSIDILARYGGEEFIAILHKSDITDGLQVAERIRAAVEALELGPDKPRITTSVGVASGSSEHLIEQADKALYEAKRKGRNRVERG